MECKIQGCTEPSRARGLCRLHYDRRWRSPAKARRRLKQWRKKNPANVTTIQLRYKYGIALEDKRRMYEEQKGLCGVCDKSLPVEISKCCTDHNHTTDIVRALLHRECNIALGYFEKNPDLIVQIPAYLKLFP